MAIPATLWAIGASAVLIPIRVPESPRYLFPATIAVLLVAVEAARGVRFGRGLLLAIYALVAIGVATNVAELRNDSGQFRQVASATRADLATVQIGAGRVPQHLSTGLLASVLRETGDGDVATGYIEAEREFGSPAFSLPALRAQPEPAREHVDAELVDSLQVGLQAAGAPGDRCRRVTGRVGEDASFEVPARGAVLETASGPADLKVRRFGTVFSTRVGRLTPGERVTLSAPRGLAPDPWYASASARELTVCEPHGKLEGAP
jgi:hypothetical protein